MLINILQSIWALSMLTFIVGYFAKMYFKHNLDQSLSPDRVKPFASTYFTLTSWEEIQLFLRNEYSQAKFTSQQKRMYKAVDVCTWIIWLSGLTFWLIVLLNTILERLKII
ncbi:hypothetical protein [Siphonobacter sp. SORGH_AS_0500]|uniref:hypothetical protein n=1 Tax=Siphonobacter sp. SORGH_AS_0500 TaxID=1864824 RepID=UPI00285C0424|nr:hypothetical protein [Siphonobacter sp. SORGH_AS_0500]MDR6193663.1 hypothetical protein [Siphonobacter sp. SORGH_AS_0500]